jgi:hypothetical protein
MRSSLFFFLNTEEEAAQKRAKSENECSFFRERVLVSREGERKRATALSFFERRLFDEEEAKKPKKK